MPSVKFMSKYILFESILFESFLFERAMLLYKSAFQMNEMLMRYSLWWWFCHSVVSSSLWPYGLQPARLLCPWDFPGKNTGVGWHFLLQGIYLPNPGSNFSTQGSNPHLLCLLYWQVDSLPLCHLGDQTWI